VFFLLNLTTTKWRFISLPDALNIIRAATVLTIALPVLDYIFLAPNVHGTFFLGKVTIIREACDLVITAATHALGAARSNVSVYVLNMGQPVKIVDLAERMIRPSGLQPGYDIEIVFTGMRPGERLNEILFASEEPTVEIGIAGIMAARPYEPPMQTLRSGFRRSSRRLRGTIGPRSGPSSRTLFRNSVRAQHNEPGSPAVRSPGDDASQLSIRIDTLARQKLRGGRAPPASWNSFCLS
jgi:FlaA1/EpsC-like NDP-sugar epimerase